MAEPQVGDVVPQVSFKKRTNKSNFRKRPATPPPASDSDSGFTSSEDESGHRIKRRRKTAGVTATSTGVQRPRPDDQEQSNTTGGPVNLKPSDDATKTSNWYETDPKFLLGNSKAADTATGTPSTVPDGTYRGASNYSNFIQKNPDAVQSKTVGPVKQPSNVRTITYTDFAPDVCKDYKQTGFCGFGDSCKFLHAREDYKQGWELDRDWEIGTKSGKKSTQGKVVASANRNKSDTADDDDEALLESIPFACVICKKSYTNPIVTKCGHYFCEACALQRYRKKPDCAVCGAGTGGVFNVAKKLKSLLERKRERAQRRREKAKENGEDVSDGEEDPEAG